MHGLDKKLFIARRQGRCCSGIQVNSLFFQLYDLKNRLPLRTFTHSHPVNVVKSIEKAFVACATNNDISIWDIPTGELVTTLSHADTVKDLKVLNSRLLSGSYDHTMKLWNLESHCRIVVYFKLLLPLLIIMLL